MKIAVFNCPEGITAEAVVRALIDAGLPRTHLQRELKKRRRNPETKKLVLRVLRTLRQGGIIVQRHPERPQGAASLSEGSRDPSAASRLQDDEMRLPRNDAVVQAAIGLQYFQIEKCFVRNLGIGKKGNPRTLKLLKGFTLNRLPVNRELVSPTGAAFLAAVSEKEDSIPAMRLGKVGFGPNKLMVSVGETLVPYQRERILLLETNIDDLPPQAFELLYDRLFKAGALDVWVESILMKKMRPAFKLSVLFHHQDQEKISEVIFRETPSLGVRFLELDRFSLPRKSVRVKTRWGPVRMKIGFLDSRHTTVSPEYEDVKRIALKRNLSFRAVQKEARKGFVR